MASLELVPRIVRPAREGGVDYGSERLVLITTPEAEVWWQRAGKAWANRLDGYQPTPGSLEIREINKVNGFASRYGIGKELHSGGRLSFVLLSKHRAALEEVADLPLFEEHLRALVARNAKTIVIKRT